MGSHLVALFRNARMGELVYDEKRDLISMRYDESWTASEGAFPLSISMPIVKRSHGDEVARAFVSGLLPDSHEVLEGWGRQFQVSARNPFRLLEHVGEECAGAVQFVRPERAERWIAGEAPRGIDWIGRDELAERLGELLRDHAASRRAGDRGQFSLAGAQPKMGLYFDEDRGRWGVPEGEIPTTHILKPSEGRYADHDRNEWFCLTVAGHLGMKSAESWVEVIGGIPAIVVKRFDRVAQEGTILRVHQEDACQALGVSPLMKYESDGGPAASDLFGLIRDYSSRPREDEARFLDALLYNWLIKGTDAHAKNYGLLLAEGPQIRLAPLYDVASFIPYEDPKQDRKTKLAMRVGGESRWWKVGPRQWERAASEWRLDRDAVAARLVAMAEGLPGAVLAARKSLEEGGIEPGGVVDRLERGMLRNAEAAAALFGGA